MNDHNKASHTCVGFRKAQGIYVTISFSFFFSLSQITVTLFTFFTTTAELY